MTNDAFPELTDNNILKTTSTKITGTSGIEDETVTSSIKIYSTSNTIIIKSDYKGLVNVYDVSGKNVANKNINAGDNTISGISSGIYIVKVTTEYETNVEKVFVQ